MAQITVEDTLFVSAVMTAAYRRGGTIDTTAIVVRIAVDFLSVFIGFRGNSRFLLPRHRW